MKIKYLEIKNYKQFKDLELDLTYPKGHEKAGEPLDKICIIGQSGTGKTNLLEVITKSTIDFSRQAKNNYLPFSAFTGKDTDDRYIAARFIVQDKIDADALFTDKMSKITFEVEQDEAKKNSLLDNEKCYFASTFRQFKFNEDNFESEISTRKMSATDKALYDKLTNARAELVLESINETETNYTQTAVESVIRSSYFGLSGYFEPRKKTISEKRQEINQSIKELEDKYSSISSFPRQLEKNNFLDRYIVNINDQTNRLWQTMRDRIDNYQAERRRCIDVLSNKMLTDDDYNKEHFVGDIKAWESENENLLEKMAEDINSILKNFNLELTKIDENKKSYNGLVVKDLSNDTILEYDNLSTGTKNLLSTFIPLKTYAPKDSIILIDEPENSFYPDIQRQLADLYMSVGDNNQLVFATHSPLVASSFEPWEIVELKFDQNNQIYREKYYYDEGENHVDNYLKDPRLLTWTGILTDIFDLKEDSNFTFREEALMKYIRLERELKETQDKNLKKEKFEALMKLSDLLGLSGNEKD